jgi:thiol-disulfide isomerase/thioredoxin
VLKITSLILWMSVLTPSWSQGTASLGALPMAESSKKPPAPTAPTAPTVSILPYATGQWKGLVQTQAQDPVTTEASLKTRQHANKPLVVHFWGVTCGPCLTEMPQWGRFVKDNRDYKVVFVQVDDVSTGIMTQLLSKAHLAQAVNYKLITPFDELMRYEVDAKWVGETPFTILVNTSGQTAQMNGLVNFTQLKKWFQQNS